MAKGTTLNEIIITLTRIKKDGRVITIFEDPKTENSKKIILLSSNLIHYLNIIKRNSDSQYVITTRTNGIVSVRSYQRAYQAILKKCRFYIKIFMLYGILLRQEL